MPETNERVMTMVEQELRANPDTSNEDLRAKAEKLDAAVGRMSARQFNATYPLQVKRRLSPPAKRTRRKASPGGARGRKAGAKRGRPAGSGRKAGGAKKGGAKGGPRGRAAAQAGGANIRTARGRSANAADGARGRVRATLLDFARDLASADGAGLVDVIAGVDGYVDRVMKATGTR